MLRDDQEREEGVVAGRLRREYAVEPELLDAPSPRSKASDPELYGVAREAIALDQRNSDTHRIV